MLTAKEAMKLALEGAKVRKSGWCKWDYVYFNQRGDLVNQNGDTFEFCAFGKWEIFKEPVKEYKFIELFDVLKDEEYALGKNGAFVIKEEEFLKFVSRDLMEFSGCELVSRGDIETAYIILKKGDSPSE